MKQLKKVNWILYNLKSVYLACNWWMSKYFQRMRLR